jgi:hypothetical protein
LAVTTNNKGHNHTYVVDENGNGTAYQKCHPDYPTICHAHAIINYQVQAAHSTNIDPINGIGSHIHNLEDVSVSAGASTPSAQIFYGPDGESLFQSVLPNVYLTKVELENDADSSLPLLKDDPHIMHSQEVTQQVNIFTGVGYADLELDSMANPPAMSVKVCLNFKERIRDGDKSLFLYPLFTNNVKLAIVYTTSSNDVSKLIGDGSGTNMAPKIGTHALSGKLYNIIKNPGTELPKYDTLKFETIPLKNIAQFNSLFDTSSNLAFGTGQEDSFKLNLEKNKQILANGDVIYNIPYTYSNPDGSSKITIPSSEGGTKTEHFTIFAMTYVDAEALIDEMEQDLGAYNLEGLGYDINGISSGDALNHLEEIIAQIGFGKPMHETIIRGGETEDYGTAFLTTDNQIWYGDYVVPPSGPWAGQYLKRFGPNDPAYELFSGLTLQTYYYKESPETAVNRILTPLTVSNEGKIIDYRDVHELQKFFFNYSDFGTGLTFDELTTPPGTTSSQNSQTGMEVMYKNTANTSFKFEQSSCFSEPMFSMHGNGEQSCLFSINIEKLLRYNSPVPGLVETLKQNNEEFFNLVLKTRIEDIKITRTRVKESKIDPELNDYLNQFSYDENQVVRTVAQSSDHTSGVLNANTINEGKSLLTGADASDDGGATEEVIPVGSIREVFVYPNHTGLRHFTFTDHAAASINHGHYQYRVEIEFHDPTIDYLNERLSTINMARNAFDQYLDFAESRPEYYDSYADRFTFKFFEAYQDHYQVSMSNFYESEPMTAYSTFYYAMANLKPSFDAGAGAQYKHMNLFDPRYGNPSGVSEITKMIETSYNHLDDLVNSVASSNSFKGSDHKQNTIEANLIKPSKQAKHKFNVSHTFKDAFDSNADAKSGYEYVVGNINQKNTSATGLEMVGFAQFSARIDMEMARFGVNSSEASTKINNMAPGSMDYKTSYLSPRKVKLLQHGEVDLYESNAYSAFDTTDTSSFLSEATLKVAKIVYDIARFNKDDDDVGNKTAFIHQDAKSKLAQGTIPDSELLDTTPNLLDLLGKMGTTVEKYGTNNNREGDKFTDTSFSFVGAENAPEKYGSSQVSLYGPEGSLGNAPSDFVAAMIAMEHLSMTKDVNLDSYRQVMASIAGMLKIGYNPNMIGEQVKDLPLQTKAFGLDIEANTSNYYINAIGFEEEQEIYEKLKSEFLHPLKFANFVMNFRNFMRLEMLSGYQISEKGEVLTKSPMWTTLTEEKLNNFNTEMEFYPFSNLVVRLRPNIGNNWALQKTPEFLKLPIFNEHFLIMPELMATIPESSLAGVTGSEFDMSADDPQDASAAASAPSGDATTNGQDTAQEDVIIPGPTSVGRSDEGGTNIRTSTTPPPRLEKSHPLRVHESMRQTPLGRVVPRSGAMEALRSSARAPAASLGAAGPRDSMRTSGGMTPAGAMATPRVTDPTGQTTPAVQRQTGPANRATTATDSVTATSAPPRATMPRGGSTTSY